MNNQFTPSELARSAYDNYGEKRLVASGANSAKSEEGEQSQSAKTLAEARVALEGDKSTGNVPAYQQVNQAYYDRVIGEARGALPYRPKEDYGSGPRREFIMDTNLVPKSVALPRDQITPEMKARAMSAADSLLPADAEMMMLQEGVDALVKQASLGNYYDVLRKLEEIDNDPRMLEVLGVNKTKSGFWAEHFDTKNMKDIERNKERKERIKDVVSSASRRLHLILNEEALRFSDRIQSRVFNKQENKYVDATVPVYDVEGQKFNATYEYELKRYQERLLNYGISIEEIARRVESIKNMQKSRAEDRRLRIAYSSVLSDIVNSVGIKSENRYSARDLARIIALNMIRVNTEDRISASQALEIAKGFGIPESEFMVAYFGDDKEGLINEELKNGRKGYYHAKFAELIDGHRDETI